MAYFVIQALGQGQTPSPVTNARQLAAEGRVQAMSYSTKAGSDNANKTAAAELRAMLLGGGEVNFYSSDWVFLVKLCFDWWLSALVQF